MNLLYKKLTETNPPPAFTPRDVADILEISLNNAIAVCEHEVLHGNFKRCTGTFRGDFYKLVAEPKPIIISIDNQSTNAALVEEVERLKKENEFLIKGLRSLVNSRRASAKDLRLYASDVIEASGESATGEKQ